MAKPLGFVKKLWFGEEAATMAEYVIMISFVAAVCATAIGALGVTVGGLFQKAVNGFP
jgi:Flp pilus assembly pilin Flp